MEDIPVHLLSSFVHFAGSKNISEAARRIGITQPALSKQLALLEAKIQQPLFMQRGRNKVLSPFGTSLYARLKDQMGGLQEAIREEKNLYSDLSSAKIRIAGRRGVLDRFSAKLSFAGRIDFYDCPNDLAVENILTLQADIGITHFLPNTHQLMAKKLFLEKFLLVVPKKLYPKRPELTKDFLEALIRIPCIAYKPRDVLIRNFIEFYQGRANELVLRRATDSYVNVKEMLDMNLGWALLPSYLGIFGNSHWILPVPERALSSRQFYLIYRPEFRKVNWFMDILSEIQACFKE